MAKVAHLTSAHSVMDSRIFVKECQTLSAAGYDTVLIAPHDSDEVRDGVQIRAVQSVGGGRVARMTKTAYSVYETALREEADLYHFHDPELIPCGIALRMQGKKVIYDVHEDLPRQILTKEWIPSGMRKIVSIISEAIESVAARTCSGIIAATSKIASRFPVNKVTLVQNFPIKDELTIDFPTNYQLRPYNAIYLGGIDKVRGAREMVQAFEKIDISPQPRLTMAGKFTSEDDKQIMSLEGWNQVDFKGWLDRDALRRELHLARVGLVVLNPTPSYVYSQPIKLFEYMAAGLPVVASDFPLWREIIAEVDCGLLVDPLDPQSIGEAIEWLMVHPVEAEEMGKRGRNAVIRKYNWKREVPNLLGMYGKVLSD